MPVSTSVNRTVTVGGIQLSQTTAINSNSLVSTQISVPAGVQSCTLTARATNLTTGTITASNSGHGIVTGQLIDVYWVVSTVQYSRQRVVVGTVSGAAIPISGGTGDSLPATTTVIIPSARTAVAFALIGNNVQSINALTGLMFGTVSFEDATPSLLFARRLPPQQLYSWDVARGDTNPLAGDVPTQIFLSHGNSVAQIMTVAAQVN